MAHARVEELSDTDSDPDVMDPSVLIEPVSSPNASNPSLIPPHLVPAAAPPPRPQPQQPPAASKTWHVLYPLYFDSSVTRLQGRRIAKELAVKNPLALTIANGVSQRGLMSVFEPIKTHPKDWANPGRVRVRLKNEEGKWVARGIKNKHHLYLIVAEHLRSNPTTPEDPLKLPLRGLPVPEGTPPPPAVPRGWRINNVVPLHSPAQTGGGVSENMLKDFQAVMQGQEPGSSSTKAVESAKKKKKDKSKKK